MSSLGLVPSKRLPSQVPNFFWNKLFPLAASPSAFGCLLHANPAATSGLLSVRLSVSVCALNPTELPKGAASLPASLRLPGRFAGVTQLS